MLWSCQVVTFSENPLNIQTCNLQVCKMLNGSIPGDKTKVWEKKSKTYFLWHEEKSFLFFFFSKNDTIEKKKNQFQTSNQFLENWGCCCRPTHKRNKWGWFFISTPPPSYFLFLQISTNLPLSSYFHIISRHGTACLFISCIISDLTSQWWLVDLLWHLKTCDTKQN